MNRGGPQPAYPGSVSPPPMIEGDHVRLRKIERADLALMHKWLNDADVVMWARFSPDHMVTRDALEKEYEKEIAGESHERATFVIEEISTAKPIGWCVMRTWDRKHVSTNVGIGLGERAYWGKGYGTEAVRLLLTIAFDQQRWHRAELWTLADNARAVGAARKCGFRVEGRERESAYFDGKHRDVYLMAILKSEWDARKRKGARRHG